ncbi:hypothetical protein AB9P05_12050 [Roseivirga sp. BDSF3-8]|uniref:hypothetical protein n=1 Tax=Roseivirga sp. BDSF3-8 TaxID=3241598 RepID=UPI003531FC8A
MALRPLLSVFLLCILLGSVAPAARAQYHQQSRNYDSNNPYAALPNPHEVRVSYGWLTLPYLAEVSLDFIGEELSGGNYVSDNSRYSGGVFIAYRHHMHERITWEVSGGYERARHDVLLGGSLAGDSKATYYTLMGALDFYYINNPNFQMYSGLSLGGTIRRQKAIVEGTPLSANTTLVAFQADLLGLRFGNRIGAFAEFGVGYEGLVKLGVSGRF